MILHSFIFIRNSTASKAKQDIVKPPNFLKRYIVDHVIQIVNDSSGRLEKAYPTVFQIYKTFTTGKLVNILIY